MRGPALVVLIVAGCSTTDDPLEPTSSGVVAAGTVDPTPYTRLAIRMSPIGGGARGYAEDVALPVLFPYRYELGGNIGVSSYVDFEVRAWLTNLPTSERAEPGEPHAEVPVHFVCDGSCVPLVVDLVLQP